MPYRRCTPETTDVSVGCSRDNQGRGSNSPFADADGNIQVSPGNQIPAIPRHRVKLGIDYAVTDAWKVGGRRAQLHQRRRRLQRRAR